jgi:TolB-like protein
MQGIRAVFQFEDFRFDASKRELLHSGEVRSVERQVLALLELLLTNRERMVSKDEIVEAIWGGRAISDGSINGRIKLLRKALNDDGKQQRLIKTYHGQGFRFVGSVTTKGTPGEASVPANDEAPQLPLRPSIAVLPFDNMSSDPEQEFLADGICEDILTALAKIPELFVIARNSTFRYKGRAVDIREVGRELGVAFVLEGSIRQSGDRLRITAQLIDARSGEHVWAERYDKQKSDMFELQDEITSQIVSAMLGRLTTTADQARIWIGGTKNFDAWQRVVRATALNASMNQTSMNEAITLLEEAVALDPDFASAHVVLANANFHFIINGWAADPAPYLMAVLKHASRAREINPREPLAAALLAFAALAMGDKENANRLADETIEFGPNIIASLILAAMVLGYLDRLDEAANLVEQCLRLSPIARTTISTTAAFVYAAKGDYAQAEVHGRNLLADDPASVNGHTTLIIARHQTGDMDAAREGAAALLAKVPDFSIKKFLASRFLADTPIGVRPRESLEAVNLPA